MEAKIRLVISGMTCGACVASVEKALSGVSGVTSANVNLVTREATALGEPEGGVSSLIQAVKNAGYSAAPTTQSLRTQDSSMDSEEREWRRRFVPSAALSVLLLLLMFGAPGVQEGTLAWIQLVLCAPVYLWAGAPFHKSTLAGLRHGSVDMNTLVTMGTTAAFLFSLFSTVVPHWFRAQGSQPMVYFDGTAVIITLILLGRWLEAKARSRAAHEIRGLTKLVPPRAVLVEPEGDRDIELALVQPGQLLRIFPGASIPVDGVVTQGSSSVDESMLTGEAMPSIKSPGDKVIGGTLNHDGALVMRAENIGDAMFLSKIHRMVLEAQGSKAPIQRLADKVASIFVPVVLVIALATFLLWWRLDHNLSMALLSMVSVLIIACPCALGLATPAAVMVGTGAAAKKGILFKGGDVLEQTGHLNSLVFDKTGTLTEGRPALDPVENTQSLALAAAVEAHSEHPLAKTIVKAATDAGLDIPDAIAFQAYRGRGAQALVNGENVRVGTLGWLQDQDMDTTAWQKSESAAAEEGKTPVFVSKGKAITGMLVLGDTVKADAEESLQKLAGEGLELHMASGDKQATADFVARTLGLQNVYGELLPDQKLDLLRRLKGEGKIVGMVGDGVNDAPALAEADVGMAMGSGSEAALETAPVVLFRQELSLVHDAVKLSRKTLTTIKQNLVWAFGYNVLAIPVAAGVLVPFVGWSLNPMIAAGAMALSSISVLLNSLRLRTSL